jgi:hypothetical protein
MMELSSFVLMLLKISLIITVLIVGLFVFNRSRTFSGGTAGKKLSFSNRTKPYSAKIKLSKNRHFNPDYVEMTVTNTGLKEIDLNAPVIIFRRWFTKRKFRVLKVEHSEIYPILLDRDRTYILDISLEQFYETVPELQLACRMSVEMKDLKGNRFKSQTIRLKWF